MKESVGDSILYLNEISKKKSGHRGRTSTKSNVKKTGSTLVNPASTFSQSGQTRPWQTNAL